MVKDLQKFMCSLLGVDISRLQAKRLILLAPLGLVTVYIVLTGALLILKEVE